MSASASTLDAHLAELEVRASSASDEEKVLWPRTPIDDGEMQRIIGLRVGASDLQAHDSRSRPHRVARIVRALSRAGAIPSAPTVLDIACGDALVLLEVQRRLPAAACFGVDLHLGAFKPHQEAQQAGAILRRVLIQDLFDARPPEKLDVAVMLNTYRGWANADLRQHERDLPQRADAWFDEVPRYVVMTMRSDQIPAWRERGYTEIDLGRGEDDSRMVLLTRERISPQVGRGAALIRARHARPRLRRRGRAAPVPTLGDSMGLLRRRPKRDIQLAVGGHWDDVAKIQFDALMRFGLEPHHRLLDMPCGSFRVGRLLIPYLEPGNYLGVEGDPELLERGKREVLGAELLKSQRPTLIARRMPGPLPEADLGWIHALFDHIPPDDVRATIAEAAKAVPRFFGTFFLTETPDTPKRWLRYGSEEGAITTQTDAEYWHHSREFVISAAEDAGLRVAGWHEYGHPLSLTAVEFVRI